MEDLFARLNSRGNEFLYQLYLNQKTLLKSPVTFAAYAKVRSEVFKIESDPHLGRTIARCQTVRYRESLFAIVQILESIRIEGIVFDQNTKRRQAFIKRKIDAVRRGDKLTKHTQKFSETILDELYLKLQGFKGIKTHFITDDLYKAAKSYHEVSCMTPSSVTLKLGIELQGRFENYITRIKDQDMNCIRSIPRRFNEYLEDGVIK